jgi:hypothetical protein
MEKDIEVECPVLHRNEVVGFDVNIFRGHDHGGLDVTFCTEFGPGEITCGKDCIHTREARELHEKEIKKHQDELAKIGPDVLA